MFPDRAPPPPSTRLSRRHHAVAKSTPRHAQRKRKPGRRDVAPAPRGQAPAAAPQLAEHVGERDPWDVRRARNRAPGEIARHDVLEAGGRELAPELVELCELSHRPSRAPVAIDPADEA